MLAVIFIPMVLDNNSDSDVKIEKSNIPPRPEDDFNSRIVPLEQSDLTPLPVPESANEPVSESAMMAETGSKSIEEKQTPVSQESPETAEKSSGRESTSMDTSKEEKPLTAGAEARAGSAVVGTTAWVVQLGSFSSSDNASALNEKLRKAGYPAFVEPLKRNSGMAYRVRVGPELKRSNAQKLQQKLNREMKIEGIVVRYP